MCFTSVRRHVVGMDEGVEVAVLELHRGLDAVAAGDLAHLGDDAQAVLDVALVVVGHLEDEEQVRKGLWSCALPAGVPARTSSIQACERGEGDHPVVDVVVGRGLAEAQLVMAHAPAVELRRV